MFILESTTCHEKQVKNCSVIGLSGKCIVCEKTYVQDTATLNCVRILDETMKVQNCSDYEKLGVCLYCEKGYLLNNGKCVATD